jgi:hypothetical protein
MGVFKFISSLITVIAAALAGNWVGEQLRAEVTGEPGHQLRITATTEEGETVIAPNPVLSNFLPGVALGLVSKPRWLWAFFGGLLASWLLGEQYEDALIDWLEGLMSDMMSS